MRRIKWKWFKFSLKIFQVHESVFNDNSRRRIITWLSKRMVGKCMHCRRRLKTADADSVNGSNTFDEGSLMFGRERRRVKNRGKSSEFITLIEHQCHTEVSLRHIESSMSFTQFFFFVFQFKVFSSQSFNAVLSLTFSFLSQWANFAARLRANKSAMSSEASLTIENNLFT